MPPNTILGAGHMTHIQPNDSQIALINTFKVDPDKAEALIALLDDATETVMKHRVGFISANIHRSLRSEEHTSELQSLMRISYAVFCSQKKKRHHTYNKKS